MPFVKICMETLKVITALLALIAALGAVKFFTLQPNVTIELRSGTFIDPRKLLREAALANSPDTQFALDVANGYNTINGYDLRAGTNASTDFFTTETLCEADSELVEAVFEETDCLTDPDDADYPVPRLGRGRAYERIMLNCALTEPSYSEVEVDRLRNIVELLRAAEYKRTVAIVRNEGWERAINVRVKAAPGYLSVPVKDAVFTAPQDPNGRLPDCVVDGGIDRVVGTPLVDPTIECANEPLKEDGYTRTLKRSECQVTEYQTVRGVTTSFEIARPGDPAGDPNLDFDVESSDYDGAEEWFIAALGIIVLIAVVAGSVGALCGRLMRPTSGPTEGGTPVRSPGDRDNDGL